MRSPIPAILFHNYYGNHHYWLDFFFGNSSDPFFLFYNVVIDSVHNIGFDKLYDIHQYCKNKKYDDGKIIVCQSPDKGKDIGGKLVLLNACLLMNMDVAFFIFLHDKKSPQSITNTNWEKSLFQIAGKNQLQHITDTFNRFPHIGLLASNSFIMDEWDDGAKKFRSKNSLTLQSLQAKYKVYPHRYQFVAGTIFAARSSPMLKFFKTYDPLAIRKTLESGNVTDVFEGSLTHSWERILSWIVALDGYKFKGI